MVGEVLAGRFRIQRLLGTGAFGAVYAAEDSERSGWVALKHLSNVSGTAIYRFKNEFRAVADQHHENLVRLYELFSSNDAWFFSMELVDGQRFDHWVLGPRPNVDDAETIDDAVRGGAAPAPTRRGATATELDRLRPALRQLVSGVSHLHALGVVHRDLKPANVLVTPAGRVVVLDFGLATEADPDAQKSFLGLAMGTPLYMAPEQAMGQLITPAADWFSVGVMLFEVLHGRPPFGGTAHDLLSQKLSSSPARLPAESTAAPELAALARALLSPDPAQRPDGAAIAAALAGGPTRISVARRPTFVGRDRELAALEVALGAVFGGRTVAVRLIGQSGVGKSALLEAFTQGVGSDVVVLQGRCYERESVPYKALDGVVDALTRYLGRLPVEEAAVLVPREAAALCRLFPVFSRLQLIAAQPEWRRSSTPHEDRRRGFGALRELLARISDRHPLVVAIDDLQWGDEDSVGPLRSLLEGPAAPRMLLLLSSRAEDEARSDSLKGLAAAPLLARAEDQLTIELGPLSSEEAVALAERLLPAAEQHRAAEVARESGGLPFFVPELVRAQPGHAASLEQMIGARVAALSPAARALLEVTAVAGRPLARDTACRAAGLEAEATQALDELLREKLVRQGAGDSRPLEAFHDRVRETVVAGLGPSALVARHAALAQAVLALPAEQQDPEALEAHLRLSGNLERARPAALAAAERATAAFAFARAISLYSTAREGAPSEERRAITSRLADVLAYSGRNSEAAAAYLQAAEGAAPAVRRELRRRAAELYLRAGVVDEGIALSRSLLTEAGLPWVDSRAALIASVLGQKLLIGLRGYDFKERAMGPLDEDEVARVDLCWTLGSGLSPIDVARATEYQSRHLRAALKLGDPYRVARALAHQGLLLSVISGKSVDLGEKLAQQAQEIATRIDHPNALGWAAVSLAVNEFVRGKFKASGQRIEAGLAALKERDPESAWQLAITEIWFKIRNDFFLGELDLFAQGAERATRAAEERGDLLTLLSARAIATSFVHLIRGDPKAARQLTTEGLLLWAGRDAWHVQHQEALRMEISCDLYEGNPKRAMARIGDVWARLKASLLLEAELERYQSYSIFIAAAVQAGDVKLATRWRDVLAKQTLPMCRVWTVLADAGLASLRGEPGAAFGYEQAAKALDALSMPLFAAAARRRGGVLAGGAEGAAQVGAADALLAARGVKDPERFARALVG